MRSSVRSRLSPPNLRFGYDSRLFALLGQSPRGCLHQMRNAAGSELVCCGLAGALIDHSMVERLYAVPFIILKKIRFAGSLWIWPVLDIVEEKVLSALGLFLRCCESDGSALDRAER